MGRVWDGPLGRGLSRKHIFDAMDQSLRRLGVDYVDLYQLHAPDPDTPIEETLRAFEDLVRMGKARYIGFSNFDQQPPLAGRGRRDPEGARLGPRSSRASRATACSTAHVEDGAHARSAGRTGIGMIVYSPLAQGVLSNKYAGMASPEGSRGAAHVRALPRAGEGAHARERGGGRAASRAWSQKKGVGTPAQVALAWVLRRPEVSSAIIGASSVGQLEGEREVGGDQAVRRGVEGRRRRVQGSAPSGTRRRGSKAKEKPANESEESARA